MTNFWRANKPASELTIAEHVTIQVLSGIVSNPRIDENLPPEIIVSWCEGVAAEFLGRRFGAPGAGTGAEVMDQYEAKYGKSITELVNERLAAGKVDNE